jgi:hypothetical protein
MGARDFQVVLGAVAVRLSHAYASGANDAEPSAAENIPYRQILLSASGADAGLGAASDVTMTNYGILIEDVATGGVEATSIGPFDTGPVKLSDFWAAGAGSTLHILAIPF